MKNNKIRGQEKFISFRGIGFSCYVDMKMKHNLVNPGLMAFLKDNKTRALEEQRQEALNFEYPSYDQNNLENQRYEAVEVIYPPYGHSYPLDEEQEEKQPEETTSQTNDAEIFHFESLDDFDLMEGACRYIGKKVVRCYDNKLRKCKAFRIECKYEHFTTTYFFTFYLDSSLMCPIPTILGKDAYNKIMKTVKDNSSCLKSHKVQSE